MAIAGYTIKKKISQGKVFSVFRATDDADGAPCVLKVIEKRAAFNANISIRIKDEYNLLKQIDSPYVIAALDWIDQKEYLGIVLEDFGADPLIQYIETTPLSIEEFFQFAVPISNGLADVHSRNIIHKDINPTNIVINPNNDSFKIIDFSIASSYDVKVSHLGNPEMLQGTLAYISPEQSGRVNRRVDQRSDLYSLGATFYHMLTALPPFPNRNPMELVYAHLAIPPTPPHEINPKIPQILSRIILKLMAKNPEERYQSVQGLIYDLHKAKQLHFDDFRLGEKDYSGKLLIPEKIYGRENEIQQILEAYQRISEGAKEMILVTGYSGTGKTALVKEVHKPITKNHGYFISGKFDQLQRTIPYFAFIQAFNQFSQLLLTERPEVLARWKEAILKTVGNLGKVLTDIFPQLELIIGKQPEISDVGGGEAQRRFHHVFQCFLQVVSSEENPLVLFIDDLQWADLASLDLLQLLIESSQNTHLLIIGAYRDNEVSATHPLMMALENIKKMDIEVSTIPVRNLGLESIKEWFVDALKVSDDIGGADIEPLARLISKKTHGNAFFTLQFLENLYKEKLLYFDFKQTQWRWDVQEIEKQNFADNVVDLMAQKIQTLSPETQETLKLAACIGNAFDLEILAVIAGKTETQLRAPLEIAQAEYLVYEYEPGGYKFVHDRIHQAAYGLISNDHKSTLHLKIGRLILENVKERDTKNGTEEIDHFVFDIVNHFNTGIHLIETSEEKLKLANLNLKAAHKAKASAAYKTGENYIQTVLQLLPEGCWQSHYDLALNTYNEALQISYLCGDFDRMEQYIDTVLESAKEPAHTPPAYFHRVMSLAFVKSQPDQAVAVLLKTFGDLGVDIPQAPKDADIQRILLETEEMIKSLSREALLNLPLMLDPKKQLVIKLFDMGSVAFILGAEKCYLYVVNKMIQMILKDGLTPEAPMMFSLLGMVKGIFEDLSSAWELGDIALQLSEKRFPNDPTFYRPSDKVCFYMLGYKMHFKAVCDKIMANYPYSLSDGDFESASSNLSVYSMYITRTDFDLETLCEKLSVMVDTVIQIKQVMPRPFVETELTSCQKLRGLKPNPALLDIDIEAVSKTMAPMVVDFYLFVATIKQVYLAYLFNDTRHLAEYIKTAEDKWNAINVHMVNHQSDMKFYIPLAYIRLYTETTSPKDKKNYFEKITASVTEIKKWADFCPVNFRHKYYLLQAEYYRITDDVEQAGEYYDKAVEAAYENEYINEAALANELAAKFHMVRKRNKFATIYLNEAKACYQKWGANAKVEHLENNYPKFLSTNVFPSYSNTSTFSNTSTTSFGSNIDVRSILKASQTLSSSVQLKSLLGNMMQILIENAGAQRSMLIENVDGKLLIQAEGNTDGVSSILQNIPIDQSELIPLSVINYVARSKEKLVFDNISNDSKYAADRYILENHPKSVVCFPILNKGELSAIIYLENNRLEGAFTEARLEILNMLSSQIAISVENTHLYENLEEKVKQRTSQLQKAHQELEKNHEELRQLTRFKEDMTAMIVHDLKNPLNSIIHFSDPQTGECPTPVKQAGHQMLNLVMNILEVQKFEDAQVTPVLEAHNLFDTAAESINDIAFLAREKNINVKNDIPKSLTAGMEKSMINRVFVNLLTNAVKFTPINGRITLTAEAVNPEETDSATPAMIRVSVSDTGEGISTEALPYVFNRFHQVEAKKSGNIGSTGIGLTYCKLAVEAHGGTITAESRLGKGSVFIFTLPGKESIGSGKQAGDGKAAAVDASLQLSQTEIAKLKPHLPTLAALMVHQFTDILDVLDKIPAAAGSNLFKWKEELQFTVYSCNQEKFKQLIDAYTS